MSTPVKAAKSLLLGARALSPVSPNLLSLQPPKINKKQYKTTTYCEETNKTGLNITVTKPDEYSKQSFLIDSPNKRNLLKFGFNECKSIHILGRGTFGTVFEANYKGQLIAAKLSKPDGYVNETNALHLDHKNIIKTIDVIYGLKYNLILMEYWIHSKNLQTVLDDMDFILKRDRVIRFAQDIILGLKYCHDRQVLHLDIKPKNILMCDINKVCKICDFGNSFKISDKDQAWNFKGTAAYTAPEILRGRLPCTKSDIYSFGILLWQLICRKNPYESIDNQVLVYKVVKFKFRPTIDKTKNMGDLLDLCSNCWHENSECRPEAREVYNFLHKVE